MNVGSAKWLATSVLGIVALGYASCAPSPAVEGAACEKADDCAEGMYCLGRLCRAIPDWTPGSRQKPAAEDAGTADIGSEISTDSGFDGGGHDVWSEMENDAAEDAGAVAGADAGDDGCSPPDRGPAQYAPALSSFVAGGLIPGILDSNAGDELLVPTYVGDECGFLAIGKINKHGCPITGAGVGTCNSRSLYLSGALTDDYGMILVGVRFEEFKSESPIVVKLARDGGIEWLYDYGGPSLGNDVAAFLRQTDDLGYIVAGKTESFGAGKSDGWVLKLSRQGAIEWERAVGDTGRDSFTVVRQAADGGFILAGVRGYRPGEFAGRPWVVKLSKAGDIEWETVLAETSVAISVRETADLGVLVVTGQPSLLSSYLLFRENGVTETAAESSSLIRLSPTGEMSWGKSFDLKTKNGLFSDATPLTEGGFVATGFAQFKAIDAPGRPAGYAVAAGFSENGSVEWQRVYEHPGNPESPADAVIELSGGEIAFSNSSSIAVIDRFGRVRGDCCSALSRPTSLPLAQTPNSVVLNTPSTRTVILRPTKPAPCHECMEDFVVSTSSYNDPYGYFCDARYYLNNGCLENSYALPSLASPAGIQFEDFLAADSGCPANPRATISFGPNGGASPSSLVAADFIPPGDFGFEGPLALPVKMEPGKEAEITVVFSPRQPGYAESVLRAGIETATGEVHHLDVPLRGWSARDVRHQHLERFKVDWGSLYPGDPALLICLDASEGMSPHQQRLVGQVIEKVVYTGCPYRLGVTTTDLAPNKTPTGDPVEPGVLFHKPGYPKIVAQPVPVHHPASFAPPTDTEWLAKQALQANLTPGEYPPAGPRGCLEAARTFFAGEGSADRQDGFFGREPFRDPFEMILVVISASDDHSPRPDEEYAHTTPYRMIVVAGFDGNGNSLLPPNPKACDSTQGSEAAERYYLFAQGHNRVVDYVSICNDDWELPLQPRCSYVRNYRLIGSPDVTTLNVRLNGNPLVQSANDGFMVSEGSNMVSINLGKNVPLSRGDELEVSYLQRCWP